MRLYLPRTLQLLRLGKYFNSPVDFPKSLLSLKVGCFFNQPIEFPPHLESFAIGGQKDTTFKFAQDISLLPKSIKYLELRMADTFLYPLHGLPPHLEELVVDIKSTVQISVSFESLDCLRSLDLQGSFFIDGCWPETLQSFSMFRGQLVASTPFPATLTKIALGISLRSATILPTITHLQVRNGVDAGNLTTSLPTMVSLELLSIGKNDIHVLPNSLKTLILTHNPIQPSVIPPSVTSLTYSGTIFDHEHLPLLSASITHLVLPNCLAPISVLPPNITHLTVGVLEYPIDLPTSLVEFGCQLSINSPCIRLPPNLKKVILKTNITTIVELSSRVYVQG